MTSCPCARGPPTGTAAFFWHFLGPIRGLLLVTLLISGVAAGAELALYAFLGVLVDWMTASTPETFLSDHGWALAAMAFVALILRPVATLVSFVGSSWCRWLVLSRLLLPLSGRAPWAYGAFLRDAHRRGVLRQAGPVYQFRHARIQDHLLGGRAGTDPVPDARVRP